MALMKLAVLTFLLVVSVCWARTATITAEHAVLHEPEAPISNVYNSTDEEDVYPPSIMSTTPKAIQETESSAVTTASPSTAPLFKTEPRAEVPAVYPDRDHQWACPRREDIHPCTCVEVPGKAANEIETVALCRNIRNQKVLSDSMKGFQHHRIDYFVLDSCKLPPFPNGLMHNVDVKWIEVLNTTVQFHNDFLTCSKGCL